MAKRRVLEKHNAKKLGWLRDSLWFIAMIIIVFVLFRYVIGLSAIGGQSMEPTLHNGDIVIYLRPVPQYEPGDIVSVRIPSGKFYVKRVVAVGGDEVDVYGGVLYVDGEQADDPHASGATVEEEGAVIYPYKVRENNYFVLGDNRENSVDSRFFGEVNRRQIKGRIVLVIGKDGIRKAGDL